MQGSFSLTDDIAKKKWLLAVFWQHKGRFEQAIAYYQQVIERQPDFIPAYSQVAPLYEQTEHLEKAMTAYRQLMALGERADWLPGHLEYLQTKLEISRGDLADLDLQIEQFFSRQLSQRPFKRSRNRPASRSNETKAHILLYTNCSGVYGAEQVSHQLMCHLAQEGYRVTCVQGHASHYLIDKRATLGIKHIWLSQDPHQFLYTANNAPEVLQIFAQTSPDMIIFADGEPIANLAANRVAVRLNIPFVKIIHCVNQDWATQYSAYLHLLPPIYEAAQSVITVSQANLQLLRDRYHLPADKGHVIYNSRPDVFFEPRNSTTRSHLRQALGIPAQATVVFTAARFHPSKGYQHQVAAMKRLRKTELWEQIYFVWAGTGFYLPEIETMIEAEGIGQQVKLLGRRSDICDLLEAADIFALPSHFEGMPLCIMEAMAKGLAIAATDVSGIPEELGDTGQLLSDPNIDRDKTVAELADILKLWATDIDQRAQKAQLANARARQLFSESAMLSHYQTLIQDIASNTAS